MDGACKNFLYLCFMIVYSYRSHTFDLQLPVVCELLEEADNNVSKASALLEMVAIYWASRNQER